MDNRSVFCDTKSLNSVDIKDMKSIQKIKVFLYEKGFKAYNHADPVVCAAVSALSINTVNSVEALTDAKFTCEHDEDGFLKFSLECEDEKAMLLLESFKLGIRSIKENYPKHIQIEEE